MLNEDGIYCADEAACKVSETFADFCGRSERHNILKVAISAYLDGPLVETIARKIAFYRTHTGVVDSSDREVASDILSSLKEGNSVRGDSDLRS